jgi:hypothetical protein
VLKLEHVAHSAHKAHEYPHQLDNFNTAVPTTCLYDVQHAQYGKRLPNIFNKVDHQHWVINNKFGKSTITPNDSISKGVVIGVNIYILLA